MCGRYTLTQPSELIQEIGLEGFQTSEDASHLSPDGPHALSPLLLKPRYNIAPTQPAPIVRNATDDRITTPREATLLRWGLVPFWAKDLDIGHRMINARCETLAEKPAFKGAYKYRRCVVLADGFYEWKKIDGAKQPFHIHLAGRQPFAMAGLWENWNKGPEGPVETFTVITTEANSRVAELHNRMPVILDQEGIDAWLDPKQRPAELQGFLRPYDPDAMAFSPVSKEVNSPRNESPDLVTPIELAPAKPPAGVQGTLFD